MSTTGRLSSAYAMTDVREVTFRSGTWVSWVIRSSCRPSAKARLSSVPARSANGSTATAWREAPAASAVAAASVAAVSSADDGPRTNVSQAAAASATMPTSARSPDGQRLEAGCATMSASSCVVAPPVRTTPSGVRS